MSFPAIGYFALAGLLVFLVILLLTNWKGRAQGAMLIVACVLSAGWAGINGYQFLEQALPSRLLWLADIVRSSVWLIFLAYILRRQLRAGTEPSRWLNGVLGVAALACLLLIAGQVDISGRLQTLLSGYAFLLHVTLAMAGIVLVEQFYRNTAVDERWSVKHLCLALLLMFSYDFYLFTDAFLFGRVDLSLWEARGAVNVLTVPLIAVTIARTPDWSMPIFVSRHVVFHTAGVVTAGLYLILVSAAGYYIQQYGGEYGDVLRVVFVAAAVVGFVLVALSRQLRARIRIIISKNFFHYQYDYRDEWLKLIHTLSSSDEQLPLDARVLKALTDIIEGLGGALWVREGSGYALRLSQNVDDTALPTVFDFSPQAPYLMEKRWVVDIHEYREAPELYDGLELPRWILQAPDIWLLVPLLHENELFGVALLGESRVWKELNWENRDLLITAGYQSAGYLALEQAAQRLAEAKQFDGFNRLSAFVIHDLKNMIAQLSLLVKNAERHRDNPAFIDDAIRTIDNSVKKMNHLMAQLKSASTPAQAGRANLRRVLGEVVEGKSRQNPVPQILDEIGEDCFVRADRERLAAVIGHIVQNAQDATAADGWVRIRLARAQGMLLVEVADNGSGMDEQFIKQRLFRPFDTTKGLTGMGIGAFECREFVRELGGRVEVSSELGVGSRFGILLPEQTNAITEQRKEATGE